MIMAFVVSPHPAPKWREFQKWIRSSGVFPTNMRNADDQAFDGVRGIPAEFAIARRAIGIALFSLIERNASTTEVQRSDPAE